MVTGKPAVLGGTEARAKATGLGVVYAIEGALGIGIVPDILANAGGVTVSYFEWVQSHQKYLWDTAEIQRRLRLQMHEAIANVVERAEAADLDWRTAALSAAVARVADASRVRAIYL